VAFSMADVFSSLNSSITTNRSYFHYNLSDDTGLVLVNASVLFHHQLLASTSI
jgi:hypothetical protein